MCVRVVCVCVCVCVCVVLCCVVLCCVCVCVCICVAGEGKWPVVFSWQLVALPILMVSVKFAACVDSSVK